MGSLGHTGREAPLPGVHLEECASQETKGQLATTEWSLIAGKVVRREVRYPSFNFLLWAKIDLSHYVHAEWLLSWDRTEQRVVTPKLQITWLQRFTVCHNRLKLPSDCSSRTELSKGLRRVEMADNLPGHSFLLCITVDSSHQVHTVQLLFWDRMMPGVPQSSPSEEGSGSIHCQAL